VPAPVGLSFVGPVEPSLCREGRSAPLRSTRVPAPAGLAAFAGPARRPRRGDRARGRGTPDGTSAVVRYTSRSASRAAYRRTRWTHSPDPDAGQVPGRAGRPGV